MMISSEIVADRLIRHAREQPTRIAFRVASGVEVSFGELVHSASRLASALPNDGIPTRIAIACDQPMDFVVALAACFLSGNTSVPLPLPCPDARRREQARSLRRPVLGMRSSG